MLVAQLLTVCATAPAIALESAPLVKEGASLTGLTVIVAVSLAVLKAANPPILLGVEISAVPPFVKVVGPELVVVPSHA
jgi:hypothetical protein